MGVSVSSMSDASDPALPSVEVQQAVISASLNASMLLNFLIGLYTIIYGGTMHLYISRKKPNQRVVVSAISALYILCITQFIIEWYWLDQWMVVNGETRESAFLTTLNPIPSLFSFNVSLFYSGFLVSDGLLIWRCYHVWGMSLRVVAVPLAFLLIESTLLIAAIALSVLTDPVTASQELLLWYNYISSALIFSSLVTTIITTSLIGYRIHTVTRLNGTSRTAKSRLQNVVEMIVESAAAYSVILLIYAIFTVIPSFEVTGTPGFYATYYVQSMANVIAGMAPTVLMARIALKKSDAEHTIALTMPHVSELRFGDADPPNTRLDNSKEEHPTQPTSCYTEKSKEVEVRC